MRETELEDFKDVMRDASEAIGQGGPYTDGALELMFAALRDLDLRDIQVSLITHMGGPNGKWRPNVHYVREAIRSKLASQWVSADEAWATVPKLESDTGILNQVTAAALCVAQDLIDDGDMIAARRAFIEAYNSRVERAKSDPDPEKRVPKAWVSGGNHPERFQDPHGERQLLLEKGRAAGLLPAPKSPETIRQILQSNGMPASVRAALEAYQPKIINSWISEES